MPTRLLRATAVLLGAAVLSSATPGCGEPTSRVATTPARGKIHYQGKPLPRALVVFVPDEPMKAPDGSEVPFPSGLSGEDGAFVVHTYEPDDGMPVGSYGVKVSTAPSPSADNEMLRPRTKAELADVLKDKYLDPKKTGVKVTIQAGTNEIPTIELK